MLHVYVGEDKKLGGGGGGYCGELGACYRPQGSCPRQGEAAVLGLPTQRLRALRGIDRPVPFHGPSLFEVWVGLSRRGGACEAEQTT